MIVCSVCMDSLDNEPSFVMIPCGHIVHHVCALSWFNGKKEKQCPFCRQTVRFTRRVYFQSNISESEENRNLKKQVEDLKLELSELSKDYTRISTDSDTKDKCIRELINSNAKCKRSLMDMNTQVKTIKREIAATINSQVDWILRNTQNQVIFLTLNILNIYFIFFIRRLLSETLI